MAGIEGIIIVEHAPLPWTGRCLQYFPSSI